MITIDELPAKVSGMPMSEYLSHPAMSRSFICSCMEGGGEVQQFLEGGNSIFSGNAATSLGSNFDTLLMGVIAGDSLESQLRIPPDEVLGSNGSRSTKAYKEWAASQKGGVVCSEDEAWKFRRMLDAIRRHESGWGLVSATTATQNSCFAQIDGHLVKVRPDAETDSLWWDLKTTSSPKSQIPKSVKGFHYGEQEWLYVSVAMQFGLPRFSMPFLFVSTVPPYWVEVYTLPPDYVDECGERMLNAMELIALRRETGEYLPLDHGTVKQLEIPDWVRKTTEVF
jgi:hypothetical protein